MIPAAVIATSHGALSRDELRADQLRLALWMFLATVTMLFAAFTSAYVVRRSGADWAQLALPRLLWANTAILAASSLVLEAAARSGRRGAWRRASSAAWCAVFFGFVFLTGQGVAWRQLVAAGVYVPTNPHSSFFYMLTGAHAAHVLAALVVLMWGAASTARGADDPVRWSLRLELCRTFWHYLGFVWVFLFALVALY
jgi:cytochrome c oxidase subunit 3